MSTRLKKLLLNKLYPHLVDKKAINHDFNTMYVSYRHNENGFIVQIPKSTFEYENKLNKLDNKSEQLELKLERDTFIENVLTNFTSKQMQSENIPQKIVIDFSSPNIAKPFHAGHLRSTIIGNFIANINKYYENKVTKINYLGDWGTQFGILQYGLKIKNIDIDQLKDDPIRNLYEVYVYANKLSNLDENVQIEARKYFSDIEQGKTNLESWKKIRDVTLKELAIIYERLGISFDHYHWESDYNGGAIKDLLKRLEEQNLIETDNTGKKVARVKDRNITVLKSDQSTLYISRDIAALLDRYEKYNFDKMLYVVDNAQTDHFAAVFNIVNKINERCAKGCDHIKFGRIKGMSTRTGNVIFLNDILDEAKNKMYEQQKLSKNTRNSAINEKTCDILGTSAVLINDLKQRRQKDYTFDWERALQSEGDSGIKLQYLHCRLWSLEQNCGVSLPKICDPSYLKEEVIGEVVAELARFENILYRGHVEYEACIIVNYLFRLARHVNRMFNELKVKNVDPDLAAQRLLVYHSARQVVKKSLEIIGVKPLYEM